MQVFNRVRRDGKVYSFANTGDTPLVFAVSDSAEPLEGVQLSLAPGNTDLKPLSFFGGTAEKLWVRNTGTLPGSYRVREL